MIVLITGSNGMLAQDLSPILEDEGFDVVETNKDNMNILDELAIERYFKEYQPDYVVHTAAYTNVNKAELEPKKAHDINAVGTKNIAAACKKYRSILIYISTDYIFDGEKKSPYLPSDTPNPINIYGKSKLEGELNVSSICEKYYIIRTSLLYGIHGDNFVEAIIKQANNNEIKVVDDQISCPTWTVDLSNHIADIILIGKEYGIYNICGTEAVSKYDFAKEILKNIGWKGILKKCSSDEMPSSAKRPKYSALQSSVKTPKWQVSLQNYLNLR